MGYHVSITRERVGKESDITEQEWLDFVSSSEEWSLGNLAGDGPGVQLSRSMSCAAWSKDEQSWLGWSDGEIWTKNPSNELLAAMIEIAPRFKARVRGDEGESYRSLADYYYEEDGNIISREIKQDQWSKRMRTIKIRRLIWDVLRVAILIGVAVVIVKRYL